ncbi:MAG: SGNH/GDSL hydrolase family protein, partial [Candidatus Binatia bacterium]
SGIPGCSSFQARQLLTRWIPEWRPMIVVLLLGRNDGRRSFLSDESTPALLEWKAPGLRYVFPFMFLHYRSVQYAAQRLGARAGPRVSVEQFYRNMNDIIDHAGSRGATVILLQHWSRMHAYDLGTLASEHRVPYLPLPSLLAREAAVLGSELFSKAHFHPTPAGYRVIARELADVIMRLPRAEANREGAGMTGDGRR